MTQIKRAWNAFRSSEEVIQEYQELGPRSATLPPRPKMFMANDRSIVSSIYTRLSIDVAGLDVRHIQLDDAGRYSKDVDSELSWCLLFEPNLDQGPRQFLQDVALTVFELGVAVIVPVDTTMSGSEIDDVWSLRVGHVVEWFKHHVKVSVYNENLGARQDVILEKRMVSIILNPLYSVMNEPNSTLQRLIRKLQLLDVVDEQSGSGKLDLIIQLPYTIKTEARRQQAELRKQDIEFQLKGSQYGIAYTDGTEKITQLNRPAENNLLKQVEYLMTLLYEELGLTKEVMSGTADEKAMINYFNRTIEPVLDAIVEAMQRSFIGKKRTRAGQRVAYFRDPFKLVPISEIATIADKMSRNEILTSNEIRGFIGVQPSTDPKADKLVNSNMPQPGDLES
jgi:Phage portal protein